MHAKIYVIEWTASILIGKIDILDSACHFRTQNIFDDTILRVLLACL
jgi:hypothetical protein